MPARMIRNDGELQVALSEIAEAVINKIADKVLDRLKDNIRLYTYFNDPNPNKWYYDGSRSPTFEFLKAWTRSRVIKYMGQSSAEVFYDYDTMRVDEDTYLHGDPIFGDWRPFLDQVLNVEGYADSVFGATKRRRPYWDITNDELATRLLDFWVKDELKKLGFKII